MQQIDEFIEQLLVDKGVTDLEPEIKETVKNEMIERLLSEINLAAIEKLNDDQVAELETLTGDSSITPGQILEFYQNAGLNYPEIVADTMLKFRGFYLGAVED